MGGGAVLEAMAGLCHHSEEVHVELFEVETMQKGKLQMYSFAYICSILLTILQQLCLLCAWDNNTSALLLLVYLKLLRIDIKSTSWALTWAQNLGFFSR